MTQPILPAGALLDVVSREEERIADYKRRVNPLTGSVRWELIQTDRAASIRTFWPSDPAPVLFRGQIQVYEPCVASMHRALTFDPAARTSADWLRLVVAHARSGWFVEHLRHHPFGRWALQERVDINTEAVAQHYGLPTPFIDLTESPAVAAFFATCAICSANRPGEVVCSPVAEGTGILYRIRTANLVFGSCRPIGLQPFPRPKEQWAWTYELWHGEDFQVPRCNRQPCVESVLFQHSAEQSEYFLKRFQAGHALFPPDVLSEIADEIRTADYLPLDIFERVLQLMSADPNWAHVAVPANAARSAIKATWELELREGAQLLYTEEQRSRIMAQPMVM